MRAVDAQQFAAPRGAVGAEPHTVQRQPEHRTRHTVLGDDGGNVRMVVLDRLERHLPLRREPRGKAGAEEIGMKVVRHRSRLDVEDRHEVRHGVFECSAGRRVVEVADMLGDEGLVAARHADGVLEVAADRDHRRPRCGQHDRPRRVAPCAADELMAGCPSPGHRSQHAVVAADHDVTVVHQPRIGNARQPRQRLIVAGDQRLAPRIGAGHHQRQPLRRFAPRAARRTTGRLVEQQVLQWRVGQHDAQPRQTRSDTDQCRVGCRAFAQQHDRPLARIQQRGVHVTDFDQGLRRSEVGHHHGQRLFLARLAFAQ